MNWRLLFILSLSLLSGFIDPFTENLDVGLDLPCLSDNELMTTKDPSHLMDRIHNEKERFYGVAGIHEETQIISDNTLTNRRTRDRGQNLLILSGKKNANLIRSMISVMVIIGVALLPKGIMIYIIWRKSRSKQIDEEKDLPAELMPGIYEEEIRNLAIRNDPVFLDRFRQTYPEFTRKLLQKHPKLLKSELMLCAFVFLDFSSKEIATYTFLQHRSVQTKKGRLRKKLQLSSSTDLYKYIRSFA